MLVVASLWAVRSLSSQRLGMRLSQDRESLLFLLWTRAAAGRRALHNCPASKSTVFRPFPSGTDQESSVAS